MDQIKEDAAGGEAAAESCRRALKAIRRFAAVTAPAVTLLLAARSKPATAQVFSLTSDPGPDPGPWRDPGPPISSRQFKSAIGPVDVANTLAVVASRGANMASLDPIDGVGLCLAAIKGLAERVERLQREAIT